MRHRRFSKTMRGLALVIFLTGFTLTGIVPWPAWDTAHAAVTAYSVRGAFLTDLGGAHTGEVTFDDLAPWTDVEGQTVDGIYFKTPWLGCDPYGGSTYRCGTQTSAPLTVITGITGMPATTGANLLSPGGTDIAACSDPSLDNDDLVIHFMEPVSAVGLDVILQIDGGSNLGVRVLGSSGNILYDEPDVQIVMPITPYTGVRFIGFISDTEDIARVEIDEYDEECTGYDAHVGYDSIVYADPLNEEGFTFSPNIILPGTGSTPNSVAIGDVDRDGIGDMAVALPGINRVALYAGVGDHPGGAMPVPVLLDTGAGSAPSAVTFGDLNGDGRLDLAVAAPGVNRVFLYAGVGDHPGTNPVSLYAGGIGDPGTMPVSVAIGDLNGDMRPDLATANFDSDSVTLYRNSTEFCDGADDDSDGQTDENFPSGDTSCGADVEVTRPTSFGDVAVKYPGVNYPGDTTVTTGNTGDAPPSGHSMGRTPVWYDIATTANFTGAATVCLDYDEANYSSELRLRLFHYNGSGWNNITTSQDTTANIICGNTTSFSPFIIAEELSTAVTLQNISALPDGNQVIINWSTSFEIDNEGFVILRSESPNGPFIPITQGMIPAMGGAGKATYTFTDANVESGKTYYYRLHDIDTRGKVTAHQVIPATDAVAKAGENTQGTAGKEDKASSASQQTKVASDKDIIEGKSRQPGQPAAWMSVVMEESENMPSGNTGLPPTLTIPRPVATAFGASGNPGVGNKEELAPAATAATTGVVALQNNPAITGGNALQPQGPSSFSVSIEDEKGNIIVVSKIGNTAGTDAQISGQSDRPEGLSLQVKEDSGRIVLTWEGRRGVKGFILQRSEKGKDSYAPVSSLIPYFGQDDKDVLLYRFSDMNAKPGVKYDYRLERVEADPKGGLKIGKLVD